jgi:hypothetical protein
MEKNGCRHFAFSLTARYVLTAAHCTCTDHLKCNDGKPEYKAKDEFLGNMLNYFIFIIA